MSDEPEEKDPNSELEEKRKREVLARVYRYILSLPIREDPKDDEQEDQEVNDG
jgi:hypothetical protein